MNFILTRQKPWRVLPFSRRFPPNFPFSFLITSPCLPNLSWTQTCNQFQIWWCWPRYSLSLLVNKLVLTQTADFSIFILAMSTIACALYAILFLKVWSYVQVNHWCRTASLNRYALIFVNKVLTNSWFINQKNYTFFFLTDQKFWPRLPDILPWQIFPCHLLGPQLDLSLVSNNFGPL